MRLKRERRTSRGVIRIPALLPHPVCFPEVRKRPLLIRSKLPVDSEQSWVELRLLRRVICCCPIFPHVLIPAKDHPGAHPKNAVSQRSSDWIIAIRKTRPTRIVARQNIREGASEFARHPSLFRL